MTSPRSIFTAPETINTTLAQKSPSTSRRLSTPEYLDISGPVSDPACTSGPYNSFVPSSHSVAWVGDSAIEQLGTPNPLSIKVPPNPRKRPLPSDSSDNTPGIDSLFAKRPRIQFFPKHTVSSADFQLRLGSPTKPTSPLFFSNSNSRPLLPARFSSGEAGARMLSQAHAEEKVKTVTLARASYSGQSPPGSIGLPSHRASLERSNTSLLGTISPEEHKNDVSRMLGDIGVLELLEQDYRPTFIVDLSDGANYSPGPLRMIFANSSLRSNLALFDFIQGRGSDASPRSEPLKGFPHFKAWLLSATLNGESLDVCLPAFVNGGVSWSLSTIRKRLRVASASPSSSGPHSNISPGMPSGSSLPYRSASALTSGSIGSPSLRRVQEEPQDYFGDAVPSPVDTAAITKNHEIMTSVETPSKMDTPTAVAQQHLLAKRDGESLSSFTNESVLSAASAGNVDYFVSPQQDVGFFDWTRMPFTEALPRHIQFARSVDWGATPLGPIEFWSPDLRQMCNLIMASPHPAGNFFNLYYICFRL
jgi:hypothetical protein